MKVLVVGGAGYIGSHMVHTLVQSGINVVVLDDLSGGCANAVIGAELIIGTTANQVLLHDVFKKHRFDAVMHFASFIEVSESLIDPSRYYSNNVSHTISLLDAMRTADINRLIFSSTAAVYGTPSQDLITESHLTAPINPYGRSKLMVEQILEDYDSAYGFKSVCLRYFNAAGSAPGTGLGERHHPETHLIPLVLQAASGRRSHISIFGNDYDTHDGTCVRDYIHVLDLCQGHLLALRYLLDGGPSDCFNLGSGKGFSVAEVVESARRISQRRIPIRHESRRGGDPSRLVADASKARSTLGWAPRHSSLDEIIQDSWAWEHGYPWTHLNV